MGNGKIIRCSRLYRIMNEIKGVSKWETRKKQYIYVLKLIQPLLNVDNWTEREEKIVDRHFIKLQKLLEEGILVLAGKTMGIDEKTFGIVILEVESEEEARMRSPLRITELRR